MNAPAELCMDCQCDACRGTLRHASDCAVHNATASPAGECDCVPRVVGAPLTRAHFVAFEVPGQPVAKGRPIIGMGFHGRPTARTPAKTVAYESLVALHAAQAMHGRAPFAGPMRLSINVWLPVAQSWPKRKQAAALAGELAPTKKPDLSNVLKSIEDGMNSIVWLDDAQVVETRMVKAYAIAPKVIVQAEEINKGKS